MCEFGELSADAGSLGHLASAKEKGKLFHCCEERGGNRNFWAILLVYFETTREKLKSGEYRVSSLHKSSECVGFVRLKPALCGPDFPAFTKECVFVSEDFGWSECATGENLFSLVCFCKISHLSRCDMHSVNSRLCCSCSKSGNEHFYSWKINWNGRC